MNEGEAEIDISHGKRLTQNGVQGSDTGIIALPIYYIEMVIPINLSVPVTCHKRKDACSDAVNQGGAAELRWLIGYPTSSLDKSFSNSFQLERNHPGGESPYPGCLKEMNGWLDEMRESEELRVTNDPAKDEKEVEEIEDVVWVEKTGECLVVHFKCPCGKGYQILLSGGKCYCKLM
ncbi:hypothetical protein SLEP1_g54689 [Rubroshorea leprosula]|uniref:Uncharacterized protein n=1 Tax=Rubroshorea leprosula TaxID=152421 RepID=A0AAV5MD79_9ROSI|nr:hypothetical protein SLEP1_g54689 [Rubroshorea leprosula]